MPLTIEEFQNRLADLCPPWPESRFLVACSGGLDSTALLRLAASALPPGQVAAAHLNHRLRGAAAEADQAFVEETACSLGIPVFTADRDVPALARERGRGLEDAAREARYAFLSEAAAAWPADVILTGHQADDQAETILLRLVQGCGSGGLAGIPPAGHDRAGVPILRPLLAFSRAELRAWMENRGFDWIEDLSNQDPRHPRNALRRDVLPALARLNPRLPETMGRLARILRAEEDFWDVRLGRLWDRAVIVEAQDRVTLSRRVLDELTLAERRRLIYKVLRRLQRGRSRPGEPVSFESVDTALDLLGQRRHRGLDLPGGLRAEVDPNELRLSPASRFLDR